MNEEWILYEIKCILDNLMCMFFEKWLCKIEKVGFYIKNKSKKEKKKKELHKLLRILLVYRPHVTTKSTWMTPMPWII